MDDDGELPENGIDHRDRRSSDLKKHKKKKRKTISEDGKEEAAVKRKELPTVSIAVAGSIVDNAQSLELATLLAGQIARAAAIFRIDEVVVFDSKATSDDGCEVENGRESEEGALFLAKILQFLETPQYLRRRLFPKQSNLKYVGLLPPLDAPHHLRKHEWAAFREGITLAGKPPKSEGTFVDVGLTKNIVVEQKLEPGVRVTVAMGANRSLKTDCLRKVVTSMSPRDELGLYWGYKVRYASNISSVFKNCPFEGGYDHIIGTSEHGLVVKSSKLVIPPYRHLLIAFGGLGGLEENIEEDTTMKGKDVKDIFHSYLNTCPLQGSRTIRTEEAILISLKYFQDPIKRAEQQYKET